MNDSVTSSVKTLLVICSDSLRNTVKCYRVLLDRSARILLFANALKFSWTFSIMGSNGGLIC